MRLEDKDEAQLIDAIYDAALEPSRWSDVITRVADHTRSMGGIMYRIAPHRREVIGRSIGRLDPDISRIYEERHFDNAWSGHMFRQPAGALVLSDEIISYDDLAHSAFHADVLAPQSIRHNYMSPLIRRADLVVGFNITRSHREGEMEAAAHRTLSNLIPHLQRASQLHLRAEQYEALREASLATLDRLDLGVLIVDRWHTVLFANRMARECSRTGPLTLRDRQVGAAPPAASVKLRNLVDSTIAGGSGGAMALPDPAGRQLPVSVLVAPLRGRIAHQVADGHLSGAAAVIFLRDPNRSLRLDPGIAAAIFFDLTPAEARVMTVLLRGEDLALSALELGISINTLKTHMRRIFAKLGVDRHAELIRHVDDAAILIRPD
jgi:DNA-binding CsgD family transcriptional regulator